MLSGIIASGIETGEFKPQDPARAASCIHFALVGFCHPVVVAQKGDDPEKPAPAEMAEFLIRALKA
jgi:hypothetical protein